MDHVPLGKNKPWPHIPVPYYNCKDFGYDFTPPWETWADRHNYTLGSELYYDEQREGGYPDHLRPQLAAFIQSWLWFGLLCEFLQLPYRPEDWLIKHDFDTDERPYKSRISTGKLLEVLDAWCLNVQTSGSVEHAAILTRVDRLLDLAIVQNNHFQVSFRTMHWVSDGLPEPLIMSTQVLLGTLAFARDAAFPEETPHEAGSAGGYFKILTDRMLLDGWCPVEINRFERQANIFAIYSVSSLGSMSALNHLGCEGLNYRCRAAQVDNATYQTQHVSADCTCPMSRNLSRDVATIISQGHVPLVRLERESMNLELQALDLAGNCESIFVAISHVWSDGLGNPHQNCIPLCQLRRIQDQAERAICKVETGPATKCFFWLDTLCVPTGDGVEIMRRTAIMQMVHVYRHARLTLIINKDLGQVASNIEAWELSARITHTAWFSRLWTLHEGLISRRSEFQLSDSSIVLEELDETAEACPSLTGRMIRRSIRQHVSRPYTLMTRFRKLPLYQRSREIWSAIQWRSTSCPEDETICLANILEIDLSPILAISREDPDVCAKRMKAFILQQKLFPRDSPFRARARGNSTLLDPGFRWAPTSFIFRKGEDGLGMSPLVEASSEGLHVKMAAFLPAEWEDFLRLAIRKPYSAGFEPHQLELVHESLREDKIMHVFMVPHQWDYHYTIHWPEKSFHPPSQEVLDSTRPAILLEEDLANKDLDQRSLYFEGQRIREFPSDADSIFDDMDATEVEESDLLDVMLVAVPKTQSYLSYPVHTESIDTNGEASRICRVTICGFGMMRKAMFESRRYEAVYQIGDASLFVQHPKNKIGWFEALPSHTSWCIG